MPPPPPNAMMAALAQSRDNNPAPAGGPPQGAPTAPPMPPGGDPMDKLSSSVMEISSKLDKVLEAISSQYRGKEPAMPENDGNEAQTEK